MPGCQLYEWQCQKATYCEVEMISQVVGESAREKWLKQERYKVLAGQMEDLVTEERSLKFIPRVTLSTHTLDCAKCICE